MFYFIYPFIQPKMSDTVYHGQPFLTWTPNYHDTGVAKMQTDKIHRLRDRAITSMVFLLIFISSLHLMGLVVGTSEIDGPEAHVHDSESMKIRLKSSVFDPVEENVDSVHPGVHGTNYYLMQLSGPVRNEWFQSIANAGFVIYEYIPDNTYLVGTNEASKIHQRSMDTLPVRWIGGYLPEYKVHPLLLSGEDELRDITILIFDDTDAGATLEYIERRLDNLYQVWSSRFYVGISGSLRTTHIHHVAALNNVYWMEPYSPMGLLDEVSAEIVGGNWTAGVPWGGPGSYVNYLGYDGQGVRVAVADTGISGGQGGVIHPDLRVSDFFDYTPTENAADGHAHGTHCAGIIAGDGTTGRKDSDGYLYGMGVAPASELVAQKIFNDDGSWGYPNYSTMMADAYNAGATVSSNSWGGDSGGDYNIVCAEYDALVRDSMPGEAGQQSMITVFAAGNAGPHPYTIAFPGVAKNVITVGASENYRPDKGSNADNIDHMASFSSRGPTADGRIKPDMVAPGTWISSARSDLATSSLWGVIDEHYLWSGGTSMAAPHVAGGSAVFVQYYRQEYGVTPSPAMTRGALVTGAMDMSGGGIPDFDQGWGRLNLTNAVRPEGIFYHEDQVQGISTGESVSRTIYVGSTHEPLKVVLSWTDPPASPAAQTALVNDLDLTVRGPDGRVFRGNQFIDGWSDPYALERDDKNNLEAVYIPASELRLGEYVITITGVNIPVDCVPKTPEIQQDFALVASYMPPSGDPMIGFDRDVYNTEGKPMVTFVNTHMDTDTVVVHITSKLTGDREEMTLTRSGAGTGVFTGSIELVLEENSTVGNGVLEVLDNDWINVTYTDDNNGNGEITASARIDVTPPQIGNVTARELPHSRVEISWSTHEPGTSRVIYGMSEPPDDVVENIRYTMEHSVVISQLRELSSYYFYVESTDKAGNAGTDDNDGRYFTFFVPRSPTVLLVDDDNSLNNHGQYERRSVEEPSRKTYYSDALTAAGYDFETYVVPYRGYGPPLEVMDGYDVVLWVTGYNGYRRTVESTLTSRDMENLGAYLESGGSLWLVGPLVGYDIYGSGAYELSGSDFLRKYMGVSAIYSNLEATADPVKGIFGTFMEGFDEYVTTHWRYEDRREDHASELSPVEGAFGVIESPGVAYPYHGIAHEGEGYRTVFFAWEPSFTETFAMVDTVKRVMGWLTRPPVGVRVSPVRQTGYGIPGESIEYTFKVSNSGINGADSFNIITQGADWDAEFYHRNHIPLTDTTGNGNPDTGRISTGGSGDIMVSVLIPSTAHELERSSFTVTAISTLDPAVRATVILDTVVSVIPPWADDFEIHHEGWTTTSDGWGNRWERGVPQAGPRDAAVGEHCWGTNLDTNYIAHSESALVSPPLYLGGVKTAFLSFHGWYDTQVYYDGGFVEISTDSGRSWERIEPVGGYPFTNGNFGGSGGDGYSGSSGGWITDTFDLSSYNQGTVFLRWLFSSGRGITRPGWYIDDVNLYVSEAGIGQDVHTMGGSGPPGGDHTYAIQITNTGNDADTFDIRYETHHGWNTRFFDTDWNPLSDTSGSGVMDTGMVEKGEGSWILVNVTVPHGTQAGSEPERTELRIISNRDNSLERDMILYTYARGDILLVDDDGGIGSRYWYMSALDKLGYTYNLWAAEEQGPPCPDAMHSHDAVVWFTGNHRGATSPSGTDPLGERERAAIAAYLGKGGKLYLSSQGAGNVALEAGYEDFMELYFGFKVRNSIAYFANNWWLLPNPAFGIEGNPVSDMLDIELCRHGEYFEGLDKIGVFGEIAGNGQEVFRMRERLTVATMVDNGYRTVYTGFDFASVATPESREELMKRILAWLQPRDEDVMIYPGGVTNGASGSVAEHMLRIRNLGSAPNTFELSAESDSNWSVEFYHEDGTGPVWGTGEIAREDHGVIYLRAYVPPDVEPGYSTMIRIIATSTNDTGIKNETTLMITVPEPEIGCSPHEIKLIAAPEGDIRIPLEVFNKGGLNDTISMEYWSMQGWEHQFYFTETGVPLNDTVGDGLVDTGELPGLSTVPITLMVNVTGGGQGGATETGFIVLGSRNDPSKAFTSGLRIYVPVRPNWTDDMEHGPGGWIAEDNDFGTYWQLGDPSLYEYGPDHTPSGINCWGTNIHSNYTRTGELTLTSPLMDLRGATSARISFQHWYSIWGVNPGNSRADGGYLEVSVDLGDTWKYVIPEEGYNETIYPAAGVGRCYGQNSNGWLTGSVDLTEYVGNLVLFRFHFWGRSPGPVTRWAGWYVDDVTINATFRPVATESSMDRSSNYCGVDGKAYYNLTVTNLGQYEDVFDLFFEDSNWTYNLYNRAWEPMDNTGPVKAQETVRVIIEVIPPSGAATGEFDRNTLKLISRNDPDHVEEHTLYTMIPFNLPYFDDIEHGKGAWRHYRISGEGIEDNWDISANRAYIGDHSWWSGPEIATWVSGGDTALETPFFDLTGADEELELTFWHWYSFESSRYSVMDGGIVEIWDNRSGDWQQIHPEGGYDRVLNELYRNPLGGREAFAYTGTFPGWKRENFPVSEYTGLTVKFRFRVGWNLGERGIKEGWYIDGLHLGGPIPDVEIISGDVERSSLPGETTTHVIVVGNTGKLPEVYNITWATHFHSTVELFDISWDPVGDTGPLDPGEQFVFYANVTLPHHMEQGELETVRLRVFSDTYPYVKDHQNIKLGVPVTGPYQNHFSQQTPGWTHTRLEGIEMDDDWQLTSRKYHVGGSSWWSGYEGGGWPRGGTTALISPYIDTVDMGHHIKMSFWHWYEFGSNFEGPGDGGVVEIWDHETMHWERLYPTTGYPVSVSRRHGNPLEGSEAFGLTSIGWRNEIFDLSPYQGKVIRLRFVVGWDSVIEDSEGWYIDDFRMDSVDELMVDMDQGEDFYGLRGQRDVVAGRLHLSAPDSTIILEDLELYLAGTGRDADVETVLLYLDMGGDGQLDPDHDILLGKAGFTRKRANFPSVDLVIPQGESRSLLAVFNISEYAPSGILLGTKIVDVKQFGIAFPDRVGDLYEMRSPSIVVRGDDTSPKVISTYPGDGDRAVALRPSITVEFDKTMCPLSVERGISFYQGYVEWPRLPFSLSWDGEKTEFTILPDRPLDKNTTYRLALNASYLKDLYDNFLDGNGNDVFEGHPVDTYMWSFTTATTLEYDVFPPHVVLTVPSDTSVSIKPDTGVVVVFNESMDTTSIPYLEQTRGTDPGGWNFAGWSTTHNVNDTASWTHHPWSKGMEVTLEITDYRDLAGNTGEPYNWNFRTYFTPYESAWPVFKHDTGRTGQSPYDTSDNPGQLEWSFSTLGSLTMQPVTGIDGTIYVGDHAGYIYAVSPGGETIWMLDLGNGSLLASPAVGLDGTVYVGSFDGNLYAVDTDGIVKWSYPTGGPINSSPALGSDGSIYIGSFDNYIRAIDTDGNLIWEYETGGPVSSSISLDGNGTLYAFSFDGNLYALNRYGNLVWRYDTGYHAWSHFSPVVSKNGTVYFDLSISEKSRVYVIGESGTLLNEITLDGTLCTSPSLSYHGTVYMGVLTGQQEGLLYALDGDGTVKWTYQVNSISEITLAGDGSIYVGSGELHSVNPDGTVRWTSPSPYMYSDGYFGSPVISMYGTIYVTYSPGYLFALGHDRSPPTSAADPLDELGTHTNNRTVSIPFTAHDNHRLLAVELYHRREGGPWRYSNISKEISGPSYTGTIEFTAREDGFYQFLTLAVDAAGNREDKAFIAEGVITIDTVTPGIVSIHPPPGSRGVRVDMPLVVTFDEPVSPSTVTINLRCETGVVNGTWYISSNHEVLTFVPQGHLERNTTYTVKLGVADPAGNRLEMEWNFTTDVTHVRELDSDLFPLVVVLITALCGVALLFCKKGDVRRKNSVKIKPLEDYQDEYFGW